MGKRGNMRFLAASKLGLPIVIGYGLFTLSGAAMWLFSMYWFLQWWGLLGILAALLVPPLATLFPFIYWWQESFPVVYILIWLVGVLGLALGVAITGSMFRKKLRSSGRKKSPKREFIEGEIAE